MGEPGECQSSQGPVSHGEDLGLCSKAKERPLRGCEHESDLIYFAFLKTLSGLCVENRLEVRGGPLG